MDFTRNKTLDGEREGLPPMMLLGLVLKVGAAIVLFAVGLKLTFWAVDVVDQILHRPDEVAILRPLLDQSAESVRTVSIEQEGGSFTFRDHNALSLFMLVLLLLVLFSAIGRAIGALLAGAVRLLASIDFKRDAARRHDGEHGR